MFDFVLDSSAALAWCFADEATPASCALLKRLNDEKAIVPSLWHLEIANTLSGGLRKERITSAEISEYLIMILNLPITVDGETAARALADTLTLACHYDLTAYDAAYLELAQRLDIPLASKDKLLCQASRKLKIRLIEA